MTSAFFSGERAPALGLASVDVTVPPNTTARLYLPASEMNAVTEGGRSLARAEGVEFIRMESGKAVVALKSGSYRFVSAGVNVR